MLFRPARASDLDEICALLATAKQPAAYFHNLLTADPDFTPERVHIAWMGGHIVACAVIYPRMVRIGTVAIPSGGIGNVRTDPRYWGRGTATSLLIECLTSMAHDGLALAPLFAKRHTLFERRGWHVIPTPCLGLPARVVSPVGQRAAPQPTAGGEDRAAARVRRLDAQDLDAVAALHEISNAARTGTSVRGSNEWFGRLTVLDMQGATLLVAERGEEIVGYLATVLRDGVVEVLELLLAPWADDVWIDLLRAAVSSGPGKVERVSAILPADYRRLVEAAFPERVTITAADDLMLRVIDPMRLLEELVPLLTARLRDNPPTKDMAVRIGPLRGGATLRVASGVVEAVGPRRDDEYVLPQDIFLELLLGVEDAAVWLDELPLPPSVRIMLQQLFPPQDWVFWRSDAF